MLAEALECIAADINVQLQRRHRDNIDRVTLSNLVDADGSMPTSVENKVALVLCSLEEERNTGNPAAGRSRVALTRRSEPAYFNVHVMFAATHKVYATGLGVLSAVIACLQAKPVFDPHNTPRLPKTVQQLGFNMEKLGYADLSNLWSYLGVNYLPSVNYTIRLVAVGEREIQGVTPAVESIALAS